MQAFHLFTADVRGDRRNTVYPRAVEINTLAQLQQAAQYDHVGAAFKDNRRQNEGFLWADCLIADVDNAAGDVVEPAQIADDLPDVQHYILFSRHHLLAKGTAPAVPRFHVLFPIDRTEDREQLEGLKRALCSRFRTTMQLAWTAHGSSLALSAPRAGPWTAFLLWMRYWTLRPKHRQRSTQRPPWRLSRRAAETTP